MLFLVQTIAKQIDACGMMLSSRIWNTKYNCDINETYDPNEAFENDAADLSVINLNTFAHLENYETCSHVAARLQTGATIRNALFIINVTIDMGETRCANLFVSLFDLFGNAALENVSVIGNVSITNINPSYVNGKSNFGLVLSDFLGGFMNPDIKQMRAGSSQLKNVSTSLKFFVDGVELAKN